MSMSNMRYYGENPYYPITPVEDTILYFPSWLEHEVKERNCVMAGKGLRQ